MNRFVRLFLTVGLIALPAATVGEAGPRSEIAIASERGAGGQHSPRSEIAEASEPKRVVPKHNERLNRAGGLNSPRRDRAKRVRAAGDFKSRYPTHLAPTAAPDSRPLVWVADGAGDFKGCSTALANANALAGCPIELAVFPWSHGYRRVLRDQIDGEHAREQGALMARAILDCQAREPGRRVAIVGHSAGCAVALAAGDNLPPNSIARAILLAPSVSTGYDLRPSLWAAREGVDVFGSRKDRVALGFVVRVVGTTDAGTHRAAGRFGFQPRGAAACDPAVSAKLRQHFWTPDWKWTGHDGGHYGMHEPAFIHAYLFPLIVR